jgi:hypothetical protein
VVEIVPTKRHGSNVRAASSTKGHNSAFCIDAKREINNARFARNWRFLSDAQAKGIIAQKISGVFYVGKPNDRVAGEEN